MPHASQSDDLPVAGAFQAPVWPQTTCVAQRRLSENLALHICGKRRSATYPSFANYPGLESPGYRQVIAPRCRRCSSNALLFTRASRRWRAGVAGNTRCNSRKVSIKSANCPRQRI